MSSPPVLTNSKPAATFPYKLYDTLEAVSSSEGRSITWLPHGRAFMIVSKDRFMTEIASVYFSQTNIKSFHRQLNLWGFTRVLDGRDRNAWYHANFVRGRPSELKHIARVAVQKNLTTMAKAATDMSKLKDRLNTPDFYRMPPVEPEDVEVPLVQTPRLPKEVNCESSSQISPSVKKISLLTTSSCGLGAESSVGTNVNAVFDKSNSGAPMSFYYEPGAEGSMNSDQSSTPKRLDINSISDSNDLTHGCLQQGLLNFYSPKSSTKKSGLSKFYPFINSTITSFNTSDIQQMNNAGMPSGIVQEMNQYVLTSDMVHAARGAASVHQNVLMPSTNSNGSASWHAGSSGQMKMRSNFLQHQMTEQQQECHNSFKPFSLEPMKEAVHFGSNLQYPQVMFPRHVDPTSSGFPIFGSTSNKFEQTHSTHKSQETINTCQASYGLARQHAMLFSNEFRKVASVPMGIDHRLSCPELLHCVSQVGNLPVPMHPAQAQLMSNFTQAWIDGSEDTDMASKQDQDQDFKVVQSQSESVPNNNLSGPGDDEFLQFINSVLPEEEEDAFEQEIV